MYIIRMGLRSRESSRVIALLFLFIAPLSALCLSDSSTTPPTATSGARTAQASTITVTSVRTRWQRLTARTTSQAQRRPSSTTPSDNKKRLRKSSSVFYFLSAMPYISIRLFLIPNFIMSMFVFRFRRCMMWFLWLSTVRTLMKRRSAISLLLMLFPHIRIISI